MRALHPSDMLMTLVVAPGESCPLRIVCRCDTNALPYGLPAAGSLPARAEQQKSASTLLLEREEGERGGRTAFEHLEQVAARERLVARLDERAPAPRDVDGAPAQVLARRLAAVAELAQVGLGREDVGREGCAGRYRAGARREERWVG